MARPAPRPRLRRLRGDVHGRLNVSHPNRLVAVLMDNGRWDVATVLSQWQLPDKRWCVMLRFPMREQATSSTQPFYFDPAVLKDLPEGFDARADLEPYPPEPGSR